ncbi:MAG: dUTP diphosphatase [Vigna little leaf phytoplasma]|nr:dUTP diphosphatase [Vigna little leaf phytoplasma]MDV3198350.1 dUTP diphosphatase [Vigna little leaf phytoplasma]
MNQEKEFFFEIIKAYQKQNINLPQRKTFFSAGYDLASAETITITPQQIVLIPTGIKAYFPSNKVLLIYARSSLILKKKLMLANNVGIIDHDYYNNSQNEGHIFIPLLNLSSEIISVEKNERIAQAILHDYYITKDDYLAIKQKRQNGFGSTD